MPRHPPNALLSLDRSHCQCSSLSRRPEGTRQTGLPFTTQSNPDAIDVFDTVALLEPRRAVHLRHILRPASRDLSGDARSGNINPA